MAWDKILIPEKGELAGEQFVQGNFTGLIPFVNQNTDYDWFPQVNIDDKKHLGQFAGYEISNMATFFGGIGTGETLIAAFRVSPIDVLHPLAGNFICLLVSTRDFVVTESETSVYIAIKVVRRIYDNDGVFTQSYPLGNYFPDKQYFLRKKSRPDYAKGNKCKFIFGASYYASQKNFVIGIVWRRDNGSCECWSYMAVRFKDSYFKSSSGWGTDAEDPEGTVISPEFGTPGTEGGYGSETPHPTFDSVSDPWVDTPTKPGVLSFGLLNVYKCDNGALQNLGRDLFPEITWPPTTGFSDLIEWLGKTIQAFSDSVWNKGLIDYIVSIHLIPVDVTAGALEDIKVGPRTMTGILARPISSDVIEIDCGTIHVDEFYTNYVDYMTRCKVYIPFYGMVTIKPEYWQSADLQLKYIWNVMDGSFIAQLYSTINRHQKPCKVMIGQYSGNACVHMPLSGSNYASMFATLAGSAGGIAAGVASGNVAVAASSAMSLAGSLSGDMQQSNSYNASSAFYGHSKPFITIERPVSHFSEDYVTEQGLPLLISKQIGECEGLTICENPILNFACPDDEAEAIKQALKEGVIL